MHCFWVFPCALIVLHCFCMVFLFFCLCVCSSSSQECNKFVIEKEHELECELFEREIEKNSEKKDIRRVVKWF